MYSPKTCCIVPREINCLFTCKKDNIQIRINKNNNCKYKVVLSIHKKLINLGTYNSLKEASFAYNNAKQIHIKNMAEKYKNTIKLNVYNTLINYIWE